MQPTEAFFPSGRRTGHQASNSWASFLCKILPFAFVGLPSLFLPRCSLQILHTWRLAAVSSSGLAFVITPRQAPRPPAPCAGPGTAAACSHLLRAYFCRSPVVRAEPGRRGRSESVPPPGSPLPESSLCVCPSGTVTSMMATGFATSVRGTGCCGAQTAPPMR